MTQEEVCGITRCPYPAVSTVSAELAQWRISLPLCTEHSRQLEDNTPLGAIGIDRDKLGIEAKEQSKPGRLDSRGFGTVGPQ